MGGNIIINDRSYMRFKSISGIIIGIVFVFIVVAVLQPAAAVKHGMPNNSCADCHRKLFFTSETQRQFVNKSTASTYAMWSISTHALFNVTCEKCHGGNSSADLKEDAHAGLSNISISRANTPETCGKCHKAELNEFKSSLHFKKLESEEGPAPACITCHQAHSIRVLTASEIEDFCSNCHNRVTGIDPSVPGKAEKALSSVNELQVEISKARSAVLSAKAKGIDVAQAEADLESARTILKDVPSVWHRFNLTYFETEVQRGIANAQKAEKETASEATPAPTKAPGFEVLLLILGLFTAYFLRLKEKR